MSSFIDRLKARMTGSLNKPLFERPKPKEKVRSVIRTNKWDEKVWQTARRTDKIDSLIDDLSLGDEHKGGSRKPYDAAPELVHDLFMSFYKAAPQLEDKRNIEREVYLNRRVIEEVLQNPKLLDLQEMTASDPTMSLVALDAMTDNVKEIITRVPPPPPPPQPKPPKRKKKQDDEEQEQDGQQPQPPGPINLGPGDSPGKPGDGPEQDGGDGGGQGPEQDGDQDGDEGDGDPGEGGPEEFDPDSEDDQDQEERDWEQDFEDLMDQEGLDLERMMNKALDQAEEEASDLDDLRKGIGMDDGTWQSMSPEERLAMAERLRTPEMRALAEAIGRMKRFALGVRATRVNDVPHEAFDVETGNDIRRLLRSEYGLLATYETSYEFYRRYVDKELLQYKMRGTEDAGKGPLVVCIDKSGSMGGEPFKWAMAVAEALRRFAADEDRDYYAMFFGANNDRERFDFPKGKGPFEKVMSFLSCIANGGTQFDGVLTEALEKASTAFDGEGKGKADIVFITDGMANLSDSWIDGFNKERERTGVRMYSIYIGGAYDMGYNKGPLDLLDKISDATIPVKELKPESVEQVFQHV